MHLSSIKSEMWKIIMAFLVICNNFSIFCFFFCFSSVVFCLWWINRFIFRWVKMRARTERKKNHGNRKTWQHIVWNGFRTNRKKKTNNTSCKLPNAALFIFLGRSFHLLHKYLLRMIFCALSFAFVWNIFIL